MTPLFMAALRQTEHASRLAPEDPTCKVKALRFDGKNHWLLTQWSQCTTTNDVGRLDTIVFLSPRGDGTTFPIVARVGDIMVYHVDTGFITVVYQEEIDAWGCSQ